MRTFIASLLAAVSLGVVATPATVTAQTSGPVRIGLEAPLTGDQKNIGIGMLDGAKLAASEINARGGLLGQTIEIVPIDDAADPATGVKPRTQPSPKASTASWARTTPVSVRRHCRCTSPPASSRSG